MIDVRLASQDEKGVLANLLELCIHDYSEFAGDEIGADGRFGYCCLDVYWTEPGRYPLLAYSDGRLAGFALVRTLEDGPDPLYSMAEFFVLRSQRRKGVGRALVWSVLERYPGRWRISQEAANLPARAFWRRVIGELTGGRFIEELCDDDDWRGPVQHFRYPPDGA